MLVWWEDDEARWEARGYVNGCEETRTSAGTTERDARRGVWLREDTRRGQRYAKRAHAIPEWRGPSGRTRAPRGTVPGGITCPRSRLARAASGEPSSVSPFNRPSLPAAGASDATRHAEEEEEEAEEEEEEEQNGVVKQEEVEERGGNGEGGEEDDDDEEGSGGGWEDGVCDRKRSTCSASTNHTV
eukprot:2187866-Rhodomonas_salina.4